MSLPMLLWGCIALTFIASFGYTVYEKINSISIKQSKSVYEDICKKSESIKNAAKDSSLVNGISYKSVA